jgi:hypothetical protein
MGDWGFKVTRPGYDITSTNPVEYVFNSGNVANVKIVIRNGTTVSISGSSYTDVSITHNLGFIPMVILYTESTPGSGNWTMGIPLYGTGSTHINNDPAYTYVDSTYFKFRITNDTGSTKVVSFYYYIFGDSAN